MEVEEAGESRDRMEGVKSKKAGEEEAARKAEEVRKRREEQLEAIRMMSADWAGWKKKQEAEMPPADPELLTDPYALEAKCFHRWWHDACGYNGIYGSIDDKTQIPCMRLTNEPGGREEETLQVFSVNVAQISGGLQWPLNVFGTIAIRDELDYNRNIIFDRDRDNPQILTEKVSLGDTILLLGVNYINPLSGLPVPVTLIRIVYTVSTSLTKLDDEKEDSRLLLTGPVRAVLLLDLVVFQVSLNVRGTTEYEDRELSHLAVKWRLHTPPSKSMLVTESYTSRLSTLEFVVGPILYSVEATMRVQIVNEPWPDGFGCHIEARTASIDKAIMLLDSGSENVPVSGDEIQLSRRVVSVESSGTLRVSIKALRAGKVFQDEKDFRPQEMGTHFEMFDIGPCKIKVTIAWSLFKGHPLLL
ncbi:hypothetical protein ACP4OV_029145 [Aristida adscensionis]